MSRSYLTLPLSSTASSGLSAPLLAPSEDSHWLSALRAVFCHVLRSSVGHEVGETSDCAERLQRDVEGECGVSGACVCVIANPIIFLPITWGVAVVRDRVFSPDLAQVGHSSSRLESLAALLVP